MDGYLFLTFYEIYVTYVMVSRSNTCKKRGSMRNFNKEIDLSLISKFYGIGLAGYDITFDLPLLITLQSQIFKIHLNFFNKK